MNRYKLITAGIDANEGIKRFNNNKEMYEKFLMNFLEDEHYSLMISCIENGDVKGAFDASHALKGISGNLSLTQLHSALIPLVEEFRSGSMEHIDELLPPVEENYQTVMAALRT